jgi:hypothetical protein
MDTLIISSTTTRIEAQTQTERTHLFLVAKL